MKTHLAAGVVILLSTIASAFAGPKEDLMAVDRAFALMSMEKGYDQAYIANLAKDGQTFTGAAPIKNKADAVARFNDPKAPHADPKIKIDWTPDTGGVSADGSLGWTEGHFTRTRPRCQRDRPLHDCLGQGKWRLENPRRSRQHRSQETLSLATRKSSREMITSCR